MSVDCFWVEPIRLARRSLRVYRSIPNDPDTRCPLMPGDHSYHDVSVVIGDVEKRNVESGGYERPLVSPADIATDPRWPVACSCGYVFPGDDKDARQVNEDRYYARSEGPGIPPVLGTERWPYSHGEGLPHGAMLRAWWLEPSHVGSDGISLAVRLPEPSGMLFPMDFPSSDGGTWTRTGSPPHITLNPSINHVDKCHGWLRDGVLVEA